MDGARFNAFKVPQLQEYLKERGISVTNINKLKLTKLCEAVDKLNLPLDPDMRKNESVTSVKHNLEQLYGFCDPFSLDGYTSDLSFIPSFSLYDLFNYLIHSTASYDRRKLKAYKSSEDYRLYFDRYVEELQYTEVPSRDICVFKAKVKPTQKDKTYLNKATYDVWVIMDKKNGEVKTAYCTCIGGADGACRHVGATLYEIEAFEVKSVTDGENQWKKRPRSHDCPVPIKQMKIMKARYNEEPTMDFSGLQNFDPRSVDQRASYNLERIQAIARDLKKISPNLQALDILGDPNDHVEEVNNIDLNCDNLIVHKRVMDQLNNNDDIGSIADTLKYSSGDIDLIEMNTRGQSNNDLWFAMRKGTQYKQLWDWYTSGHMSETTSTRWCI